MAQIPPIVSKVREIASKKVIFSTHAIKQMSRPDRMIVTSEVLACVFAGVLVEDYPEDSRGHSCLLLNWMPQGRPIHVVCSPTDEYLAVITAYVPSRDQWEGDYMRRKAT